MSEEDLIVGIHSIISALKNPNRSNFQLIGNKEGFSELQKKGFIEKDLEGTLNKEVVSSGHEFQEKAKVIYKEKGFTYNRVPSGIFLLCSPIKIFSPHEINIELESGKPQKIICLDQITDINNAAAILRTAAFYGVDFLVIPQKGNFGFTPSFYRIASGATEFVKIAQCPSLSKFLRKLQEKEILCIGFSEHAETSIKEVREKISAQKTTCLVLGSEEKGMSHAVEKALEKKIALIPAGPIKSLNVSVAAAVAMEKIFGDA